MPSDMSPGEWLSLGKAVVIDTETTGLAVGSDEILSIGIVGADGGTLLHTLVRPEAHTSWPSAQRINHIAPDMVRDAPRLCEVAPAVRTLINDGHLVVAYNARFDLGMLEALGVIRRPPAHVYDVMKEYARTTQHGRWVKLAECARHFGYDFPPHDALEDARATAFCFRAMVGGTR